MTLFPKYCRIASAGRSPHSPSEWNTQGGCIALQPDFFSFTVNVCMSHYYLENISQVGPYFPPSLLPSTLLTIIEVKNPSDL